MTDPVTRSDELDRRILAIPEDKVFTKRVVVIGFSILAAGMLVLGFLILRNTATTKTAVSQQIPGLKAQVADRDITIAQQQDVIGQQTDWILLLAQQVQDLGGTPPEIVIRPGEGEDPKE